MDSRVFEKRIIPFFLLIFLVVACNSREKGSPEEFNKTQTNINLTPENFPKTPPTEPPPEGGLNIDSSMILQEGVAPPTDCSALINQACHLEKEACEGASAGSYDVVELCRDYHFCFDNLLIAQREYEESHGGAETPCSQVITRICGTEKTLCDSATPGSSDKVEYCREYYNCFDYWSHPPTHTEAPSTPSSSSYPCEGMINLVCSAEKEQCDHSLVGGSSRHELCREYHFCYDHWYNTQRDFDTSHGITATQCGEVIRQICHREKELCDSAAPGSYDTVENCRDYNQCVDAWVRRITR